MQKIRSSALALILGAGLLAALPFAAQAQVSVVISVDAPPPPLPYYDQPPIPDDGYIWIPGYWAWDQDVADYYWVPGTWAQAPQEGLLWTPGYWGWREGRYAFNDGYWAPEVGFYGGIDYGYGYAGDGYQGGRWDHGAFFYNRTVNNIGAVSIKNVYNQTIIENKGDKVSFNGGDGGTAAKPDARQEAVAKEHHVEATSLQKQNADAAVKNRALFSKQNHGEPPVAATRRAGVFEGSDVSRGSHAPTKGAGAEAPKADTVKPNEPVKTDETKKPSPTPAASPEMKKDAPKTTDEPKAEPSKANKDMKKPTPEPSATEMRKEPPKAIETPKRESPKVEAPKGEAPKPAQEPEMRKEPPKAVEAPRNAPEPRKAEEPNRAAPKAEEKKP